MSQYVENTDDLEFETAMTAVYETQNPIKSKKVTNWQIIRDECRSGGAVINTCNVVAAAEGTGELNVIAQRLECGCILIPEGSDEVGL